MIFLMFMDLLTTVKFFDIRIEISIRKFVKALKSNQINFAFKYKELSPELNNAFKLI